MQDDKVGILDIKARINGKDLCNIEMQVANKKDIEKRMMYYWGRLYTGEIKEGKMYKDLKKTIVILIADFELDKLKDIPEFHTKWNIREEKYSKVILTDVFEFHIIELEKIIKMLTNNKKTEKNKMMLWSMFLLNPEKIGEKIMEENKDIKQAKEVLDKIKQDEREKELARLRMKYIMDQQAIEDYGYDHGLEDGMKKEKIKIAKKLLEINLSIPQIEEVTGLSKEEIEKLK